MDAAAGSGHMNSFSQRILEEIGPEPHAGLEPPRKTPRLEDRMLDIQNMILTQQGQIAQAVQAAAMAAEAAMRAVQTMANMQQIPPTQPNEGAAQVQEVTATATVDRQLRKIPEQLTKPMQAVYVKFERDVAKYLKSIQHLKKVEDAVAQFEANKESRRYPAGMRPFKPPGEQVELEHPWSGSAEADANITIKIPKGP